MTEYRVAVREEHPAIVGLARLSPYTSAFSNEKMFSGPWHYARGWVLVASCGESRLPSGFACIREKVRQPEVNLYFVGVHPHHQRRGVALGLIEFAMSRCQHRTMVLKVDRRNDGAIELYRRRGFCVYDDSDPTYMKMRRQFP